MAAFFALDALLGPGDVFLDIGANIGAYAAQIDSAISPGGLIVAFEPNPSQTVYLRRNLARLTSETVIVESALGERPGTMTLAGSGPTTAHLAREGGGGLDVEVTTLDAVAPQLPIGDRRLFIKIDVEGWEPAVLVGGRQLLTRANGVLLEANGQQDRCPVAWDDAVSLLHSAGFIFCWPSLERRTLVRFAEPSPRAPVTDDYLALRPAAVEELEAAIARMP